MEAKICQSCGMPLGDPAFYGTNEDDSRNEEYCIYCFAGGNFNEDLNVEDMIEQCTDIYLANMGGTNDEEQRRQVCEKMNNTIPALKRWSLK